MSATRRSLLAAPAAMVPGSAAQAAAPNTEAEAAGLLDRYIGFGAKASGGPGDIATGDWMEACLREAGFKTDRQTFSAPFFEPTDASIRVGGAAIPVRPLAIVAPTGDAGIEAPFALRDAWSPPADLRGKVAVIPLPYGRWSSASSPVIRDPVAKAFAAGARAAVLITTGPSGEALALNADGTKPMFDRPVVCLGPRDAAPVLKLAGEGGAARLTVAGAGGRREAFNVIGRLQRGSGPWMVVSTPRSGWDICAGERGPGVAVWVMLARWMARTLPLNLAFVCNSGHEYENLGAEHLLQGAAPRPDQTRLWIHLGANVAARDWHELGPRLAPLPSADPQRILMATPALVELCRAAFKGLPGLEAPYPAGAGVAGELGPILAAGYPNVMGVFGSHRFHHALSDDARCVSAPLVVSVFAAFKAAAGAALRSPS